MDYNAVIQSITENWGAIMSTVVVGGGSIWALLSKIGANKFSSNLTRIESSMFKKFDAVGKTTFDVLTKVERVLSNVQDRVSIMEKANETLSKENLVLSNLVIEALSVAPIPLSAKEKFYGGIQDLTIVNDKVKDALLAIQEAQKVQKQVETQKEQDLYSKLDSEV